GDEVVLGRGEDRAQCDEVLVTVVHEKDVYPPGFGFLQTPRTSAGTTIVPEAGQLASTWAFPVVSCYLSRDGAAVLDRRAPLRCLPLPDADLGDETGSRRGPGGRGLPGRGHGAHLCG